MPEQSKAEKLRAQYRTGKMTAYEYFRAATEAMEDFDLLLTWYVKEVVNLTDLNTYFGESSKNDALIKDWTELLDIIVKECAP